MSAGDGVTERTRGRGSDRGLRRLRLAAAVLGLLGALLALAVPLLAVVQHTVVITWPRAGHLAPVNAPLVAYQPQSLTATIPCGAAVSVAARSTQPAPLLATPRPSSAEGAPVGMVLRVVDGSPSVVSRGQKLGDVALGSIPVTARRGVVNLSVVDRADGS